MAGNTNIKYTTDNTPYFFDADRFEREYFVAKKVYLGKDATRYDSTGPFYYMFAKNKDKFVIAPNFNDAMDNAIVVLNSFELEQKIDSLKIEINNYQDTAQKYKLLNEQLNKNTEEMERVVREQHHMNRVNEDVYIFE